MLQIMCNQMVSPFQSVVNFYFITGIFGCMVDKNRNTCCSNVQDFWGFGGDGGSKV